MRLLHTGDWHIGKRLYGMDRLDDARRALAEVARVARTAQVDAVLVAGDNFDRRLVDPPALAVCLGALEELASVAPVVAVTGNHEDPAFWAELAPYLAPRILIATSDDVVGVDTAAGRLWVGCLPWPEPAELATEPGTDRARSRGDYAQAVRERIDSLASRLGARRSEQAGPAVLLGHLMVSHAVAGGGERELTLGGTYAIDGGSLPGDVDYVALGHLHRPQPLPGHTGLGRYAGSPMALDFTGDGAAPSVVIVDIGPGAPRATEFPIAGRRLVRIKGRLDELPALAARHPDAWFFCEVLVDEVRLDLVREVRERIPNALRVEALTPRTGDQEPAGAHPGAGGDLVDAYAEWLAVTGRGRDGRLIDAFRAVLAANEGDG